MIQLYQYEVCPYCCKVRSVLDYKKVPYEKIEVNPMTHDELAWNKKATDHDKVPVLIDGGETVLESNDIIRYLDEKFPWKPVFAKTKAAAAKQAEWIKFADDELVQILPANIYRTIPEALDSFKYISKVGKFPLWKRYYLMLGGAVAMNIVAKKGMKKRGITDPRKALAETLEKLADGLGKGKFLGGNEPDVSDLVCHGVLSSVRRMKVWKDIARNRKVADWYERVDKAFR
ncbi:MAG TPA: glutathione S-transferase N-terminal domain-containing protein [bacterium]|nr:glutathione S-transferase N-terminal domain-containing protein [bacterium]